MFILVIYPALQVFFHFHQIVTILKVLKHFLDINMNSKKTHVFFGGHLFSMCFVASHPIGMPRILNMLSCHLGYGDEPESCGRMTCIPNLHQKIYPCQFKWPVSIRSFIVPSTSAPPKRSPSSAMYFTASVFPAAQH